MTRTDRAPCAGRGRGPASAAGEGDSQSRNVTWSNADSDAGGRCDSRFDAQTAKPRRVLGAELAEERSGSGRTTAHSAAATGSAGGRGRARSFSLDRPLAEPLKQPATVSRRVDHRGDRRADRPPAATAGSTRRRRAGRAVGEAGRALAHLVAHRAPEVRPAPGPRDQARPANQPGPDPGLGVGIGRPPNGSPARDATGRRHWRRRQPQARRVRRAPASAWSRVAAPNGPVHRISIARHRWTPRGSRAPEPTIPSTIKYTEKYQMRPDRTMRTSQMMAA